MKRRLALCILLVAVVPAAADRCDVTVARIMRETGATFLERTTGGEQILRHVLAGSLALACPAHQGDRTELYIAAWTRQPSNPFFTLGATAGAVVTGESADAVEALMTKCHEKLLKSAALDDGGFKTAATGAATVTCSLLSEGRGVSFTMFRD